MIFFLEMKRPALRDRPVEKMIVLPDSKLRDVIGGRAGGVQIQIQHENQVFTTK
jgi:chromatin remodeling complex protein RSC6